MAFAFDTLGYAKKLRDAGVAADQAEAHAEAARDFVMHELVTRYDLQGVKDELETVRRELQTAIDTTRRELEAKIDTLSLRLTVRTGVMLAAGLSILAAVLKLH
jgi:uncharacterized protein YajQ (UPF0234 family)